MIARTSEDGLERTLSPQARLKGTRLTVAALAAVSVPAYWMAWSVVEPEGSWVLPVGLAGSVLLAAAAFLVRAGKRPAAPIAVVAVLASQAAFLTRLGEHPGLELLGWVWGGSLVYMVYRQRGVPRWVQAREADDAVKVRAPVVLAQGLVALLAATFGAGQGAFDTQLGAWSVVAVLLVASGIASWVEWSLARLGAVSIWAAAVPAVVTVAAFGLFPRTGIIALILGLRVAAAVGGAARAHENWGSVSWHFRSHPARLVVLTFAVLSIGGGLLLSLPACSATGTSVHLIDALFTATSASCVTGLIVVDTSSAWSDLGRVVILLLIQVGALGIMTLAAVATLVMGRALGGRTAGALEEVVGGRSPTDTVRLIRTILVSTVFIEFCGALLLLPAFLEVTDPATAVWDAGFHSISAFCNAGFSTNADSLAAFADNPWVLHVMSALILLGGLGFGVIVGLRDLARRGPRPPVIVPLVLCTNLVLLVIALSAWLLFEWNGALSELGFWDRLHNAWFQAVTLRTAGFNSVDFTNLSAPMVLVAAVLMFVGASPGSTGGGIKTTTVAVLFLAVVSVVRGRSDAEVFGRCIPKSVVYRAAAIVTISATILLAGALVLMTTQTSTYERVLFEAVSAFGTVGLSTGITGDLDRVGKIVVMVLMFVGRTGPLTMVLLFRSRDPVPYAYPEEEVLVG